MTIKYEKPKICKVLNGIAIMDITICCITIFLLILMGLICSHNSYEVDATYISNIFSYCVIVIITCVISSTLFLSICKIIDQNARMIRLLNVDNKRFVGVDYEISNTTNKSVVENKIIQ